MKPPPDRSWRRILASGARPLPLLVTLGLFMSALHALRIPPNHVIPLFSARTLRAMLGASVAFGALYYALGVALARRGADNPFATARSVLSPVHLLLLYPLHVFLLYPLECPAPLLVLLTPIVLVVAACAGVVSQAVMHLSRVARLRAFFAPYLRDPSTRVLATALFVGFLAVFVVATHFENRLDLIVGDEPHYLITMQSLKQFGTADLTRILQETRLQGGVRRVEPHVSPRSVPGKIHEVHGIGLPLLMVVPHALGGFDAVMLFFNVVTALVVANTFLLCFEVTGRRWSSFFATALIGFSCPLIFYFRFVYPDVVAALLVLYAARALRSEATTPLGVLLAGVGVAYLPWLHVKYLLLAASLMVLAAATLRGQWWRLALFLFPSVPSALLLMSFFTAAYGSWLPTAQYDEGTQPLSGLFFTGAGGLLFDRDHGLVAYAPFYLFAVPGAVLLWRRHRAEFWRIVALTLPTFVVLASHPLWWGGPAAPGRFLLPILPFLAPAVALWLSEPWGSLPRAGTWLSVTITLTLSLLAFGRVGELTSHSHYAKRWILSMDAFPVLPQFFIRPDLPVPAVSYVVLLGWVAAPVALCLSGRRGRRPDGTGPRADARHLAALTACLLWPGVWGLVDALGSGAVIRVGEDRTMSLGALNYHLEAYAAPLRRAGAATSRATHRVSPVTLRAVIPVAKSATRRADTADPWRVEYFVTGPYTWLYPVRYTAAFLVRVTASGAEEVARVDVAARSGREILAAASVPAEGGRELRRVPTEFRPDRILGDGEFRCAITGRGRVTLERVELTAVIGG